MKRILLSASLLALLVFTSGCYNAKVTTGAQPGSQTIEKPWASGFLFGLVPPPVVEAGEECPNGVAEVETKISFLNGFVSGLTFNLYTPMTINVTCAAASSSLLPQDDAKSVTVSHAATVEAKQAAFQQAAAQSRDMQQPVQVRFVD
jgi:hypothetical protein